MIGVAEYEKPYRLEFSLRGLPALTNKRRVHWTKAREEARMWKQQVISFVKFNRLGPPKPLPMAKVTLTRCSSSEPDFDGLVGSFKNVLDGLVAALVIEDDKMSNIGAPDYRWEKASPGGGKIRIVVEEIA